MLYVYVLKTHKNGQIKHMGPLTSYTIANYYLFDWLEILPLNKEEDNEITRNSVRI